MDIEKAFTLIEILIPYASPVIGGLLVYILARGKNSLFNYHLWKNKLNIDIDIKHPHLAKFVEEKLDLERIKLHYPKVNFYSLEHALEILKWAKNNNISNNELVKFQSGITFNRKNPGDIKFELPKGTQFEKTSSGALALTFLILFAALLSIAPLSGFGNSIFIKTKTTDIFLLVNSNKTITYENLFFGEQKNTDFETCQTKLKEKQAIAKEAEAICNLIANRENIDEYFKITRRETAITLLVMLPMLALGFMYFVYTNNSSSALIKFEKSINNNKKSKTAKSVTDSKIVKVVLLHLGMIKDID